MKPVLTPCDVGRHLTAHFGFPPGSSPSVTGIIRTVRWLRDADGELLIWFELEVPGSGPVGYDVRESAISRITVDGHERPVF